MDNNYTQNTDVNDLAAIFTDANTNDYIKAMQITCRCADVDVNTCYVCSLYCLQCKKAAFLHCSQENEYTEAMKCAQFLSSNIFYRNSLENKYKIL